MVMSMLGAGCPVVSALDLTVPRLIDLTTERAVGVAGNLAAAVLGAVVGWWLAQHSSGARGRTEARSAARHSLAELVLLVWPPTRYAEFMAGLDTIDADLQVAGVSPRLRAALWLVASECWTNGASSVDDGRPEPGISTKLLLAFRVVRNAVLLELAPGRNRGAASRAAAVLERVNRLIAENRADWERRPAVPVTTESSAGTIDDGNKSESR
jgi:hypothetical protein